MTAEVLDKFAQLITTALGLVAALAWNAAIQAPFTKLFGEAGVEGSGAPANGRPGLERVEPPKVSKATPVRWLVASGDPARGWG